MPDALRSFLEIVRKPVLPETRHALRRSWESLPEAFRTPQQMFGRQGNPCGATIGAMPRCDFACRGCYLGEDANHVAALSVEAVKEQMRALRPLLGNNGNLQLTDGEVTLRPMAEIVELLRYADAIGLVPMLMTHGDSFRRQPGLLERLMVDGGLKEISIHVDTTMRGRIGAGYKNATLEADLNPLRDEFARVVRDARRATGRPLVCATTMTVTRENLEGVADVTRCVTRNADAYKILSFQPIAQVGRTEEGLGGGVAVDELWREIARGLAGDAADPDYLWRSRMWLGHHDCNRFAHGFVVRGGGSEPRFHAMRLEGDKVDEKTIEEYLRRFGGLSFRRDRPWQKGARALAVVARAPLFWASRVVPYFWHLAKRMAPAAPCRLVGRVLAGRAEAYHFNIVSHHFMSRAEIETPRGRERLDLCVFRVPVGERLVSMCEANALGVREGFYADMRAGRGRPAVAVGQRLSVVIPALDEERSIAEAIRSVRAHACEIIVVDGGSQDETRAIAAREGARVLESRPGRGVQLDFGARQATGDWLVFLHADTRLDEGWAEVLRGVEPGIVGGAFRFAVDAPGAGYRLLEAGVAWRCRLFGLPYGDQGIFTRRGTYDAIGGFRPIPLMEDVCLVRRLRRAGRLAVLPVRARTSPRRWERHGLLGTTARNLWLAGLYVCGQSPERLARLYYGR